MAVSVYKDPKTNAQLKSMGIQIKQVGTTFKFVIPKTLERQMRKAYEFSIDELAVGGGIPLAELARHIDEQAGMEARTGSVAEFLRHEMNQTELEYDEWYAGVFWKVKEMLETKASDKAVHHYILKRYGKKYREMQTMKNEAQFAYRLMNNAIHAAWLTKGRLLQTLRLIIQGGGGFGIEVTDGNQKAVKVK